MARDYFTLCYFVCCCLNVYSILSIQHWLCRAVIIISIFIIHLLLTNELIVYTQHDSSFITCR